MRKAWFIKSRRVKMPTNFPFSTTGNRRKSYSVNNCAARESKSSGLTECSFDRHVIDYRRVFHRRIKHDIDQREFRNHAHQLTFTVYHRRAADVVLGEKLHRLGHRCVVANRPDRLNHDLTNRNHGMHP